MTPPKISLVVEGDAESDARIAFSGSARSLLDGLRAVGADVVCIDTSVSGASKLLLAAASWRPRRKSWQSQFRFGRAAFKIRSRLARQRINATGGASRVVLQIGATFAPPVAAGDRYALFCDWNCALAIRHQDSGYSPIPSMSPALVADILARERVIYLGASKIFCMSEYLRQSFISDFGVAPDRVIVTPPGPNMSTVGIAARLPTVDPDSVPTILFVGREFERKGGRDLLAAFARVRESVPRARLRIIGPSAESFGEVPEGVELLGFLRKSDAAENGVLLDAFRTADVYCLPTRYEPLGISVIEAMYFGLACVTSDVCALPEIVVEGETGYTMPAGDREQLAAKLAALLIDRNSTAAMGCEAQRRAGEHFSWTATAGIMFHHLTEP